MNFDLTHAASLLSLAPESIRLSGFEAYKSGRIIFANLDIRKHKATFRYKSSHNKILTITVNNAFGPAISVNCTCQNKDNNICKHQAAALYYLKNNITSLTEDYNKRFYPELPPKNGNTEHIEKLLRHITKHKDYKPNPENIKLVWINPLMQNAHLAAGEQKVSISLFFDSIISTACSCGEENCTHRADALAFLSGFINSQTYKNILKAYWRDFHKNILIGKTEEVTYTRLRTVLPFYLPEALSPHKLEDSYIKLQVKVRYKPQYVSFSIHKGKVFSSCSCNDNVKGICKHQIAALHMLTELDRHFFEHLTQKDKIEDLRGFEEYFYLVLAG